MTIYLLVFAVTSFYFILTWHNPDNPQQLNQKIIKKYQEQSLERAAFLNNSISAQGYGALYNVLVPEVFCKDLIRIGTVGDGGKWICNPTEMLSWPECKIYSLGTSNDPSFEEDLQKFLNNTCQVRSVDKDEQVPVTLQRIKNVNGIFKKAKIGAERNESENIYTFNNILSEFGDERIDISKLILKGSNLK